MAERKDRADLLTVEEVAAYLQLNKLTVYKFIHAGELAAVRLGRSFRVRRGDVDRFLEAHLVAAPTRRPAARPATGAPAGEGVRRTVRSEPSRPVVVVLTGNREVPTGTREDERLRQVMMSTNPLEWIIRGLH